MIGVLFFALTIPLTAAGRGSRRPLADADRPRASPRSLFGLTFAPLFSSGDAVTVTVFLSLGLALMGCTYGALGSALAELFPTAVRYTGASLTFNLAGILGGSLAPYIATYLAESYGIALRRLLLVGGGRRDARGAALAQPPAASLAPPSSAALPELLSFGFAEHARLDERLAGRRSRRSAERL